MGNKELQNKIDINETYKIDKSILEILLIDRTKEQLGLIGENKNIIWATDNYESKGKAYNMLSPITYDLITGQNEGTIRPRRCKSKIEQAKRTKEKAEVFTPSWVCNIQNNYADEQRFGKDVFNKVDYKNKTWETISEPIPFPMKDGGDWKEYINSNVLEITCGEGPYLVSRYDTTTGDFIEIKDRIGLLDRKFRVLNEARKGWHKSTEEEKEIWLKYAKEAIKHTYGYEWQGDNLLLARENVLFTFIDYYKDQFKEEPNKADLKEVAIIISWNLWQMDGLKFVVPMSCKEIEEKPFKKLFSTTLDNIKKLPCPGCEEPNFIKGITKTTEDKKDNRNEIQGHSGIYCKVKNWDLEPEGHIIYFGQCLTTSTEDITKQEKIKEYNKPKKVEPVKMGKLFDKIKAKEGK